MREVIGKLEKNDESVLSCPPGSDGLATAVAQLNYRLTNTGISIGATSMHNESFKLYCNAGAFVPYIGNKVRYMFIY